MKSFPLRLFLVNLEVATVTDEAGDVDVYPYLLEKQMVTGTSTCSKLCASVYFCLEQASQQKVAYDGQTAYLKVVVQKMAFSFSFFCFCRMPFLRELLDTCLDNLKLLEKICLFYMGARHLWCTC